MSYICTVGLLVQIFIVGVTNGRPASESSFVNPCANPADCQTIGDRIVTINNRYKKFHDPKVLASYIGFDIREDLPEKSSMFHRYRRNAKNTGDWPVSSDGLIYIPYSVKDSNTLIRIGYNLELAKTEFAKHTCFRLIARTNQNDYVDIIDEQGCWTYVGKIGGRQPMSLSRGCGVRSIILHEFMHVIGFYHEQERIDRDEHIKVNWSNIDINTRTQFAKKPGFVHGKDYDIHSIMQYGRKAGAVDERYDAVTPIKDPTAKLGAANDATFAPGDKEALNLKSMCKQKVQVFAGPYKGNKVMVGAG